MKDIWGREVQVGDYVLHDGIVISKVLKTTQWAATVDYQECYWTDGKPKKLRPAVIRSFLIVDKNMFDEFNKTDVCKKIFTPEHDGEYRYWEDGIPHWKGCIRPTEEGLL